jgi:hypothetical protein
MHGNFYRGYGKIKLSLREQGSQNRHCRLAAFSNFLVLNQAALVAIDPPTSLPASWF